ncbi:UNVERIFIED_CONTAM: Pentatricopeptide repeat-containing protein [Sesamum calycinum]|uniref:Pentatricopeptide repeat-containing protein n=1 Tax=Sesamum calycinum TaxID=2727403 RepID=A0AAW2PKV1_9LAMI
MKEDGLAPNVVTFNTRISALSKAGKILEASRIFRDMQMDEELGLPRPNVVTHKLMLDGFCREGMLEEAQTLVQSMKRDAIFSSVESYNIWLLGLVRNGKIWEAQTVLKEMADEGVGPNIYSYNILINGLCKNDMVADARGVVSLMISGGVSPDVATYSTLLQGHCKQRKSVEVSKVLNEMIMSGCLPNTYTCNVLLHNLWREGKIEEAERLMQKMNERGNGLDTVSCNIVIDGLCRTGKVDRAVEIVNEMWTHGSAALGNLGNLYIGLVDGNRKRCLPDLITYSTIINGLCRDGRLEEAKKKFIEMLGRKLTGEFRPAQEVFEIAVSICGHKEVLYKLMFNELLAGGEILEAKQLFEAALDRCFDLNGFHYKDLIDRLCVSENLECANDILKKMMQRGCRFDPALFMPVIEYLGKRGNKHEVNELTERMLAMGSDTEMKNKVHRDDKLFNANQYKDDHSGWRTILHRDDGSATAMKTLKRVQKGWGHGNLSFYQARKNDFLNDWDAAI